MISHPLEKLQIFWCKFTCSRELQVSDSVTMKYWLYSSKSGQHLTCRATYGFPCTCLPCPSGDRGCCLRSFFSLFIDEQYIGHFSQSALVCWRELHAYWLGYLILGNVDPPDNSCCCTHPGKEGVFHLDSDVPCKWWKACGCQEVCHPLQASQPLSIN